MEASSELNGSGLLNNLQPPRLEDAGLEDCALPPESINEAFLKAAAAARSRATSILDTTSDESDEEGTCINGNKDGCMPEVMGNEVASGVTAADTSLLSDHKAKDLLNSVDAFLFDCDGVIWKGDTLIDGVPETLELLRSKGKKLVFVTNNSRKSRKEYSKKFRSLGVNVSEDEIFSSSFAAAMYLKVNHFPRDKKVYVIGQEGILDELELAGFTALGGPEDGKRTAEMKPNCPFEHDKSVGAVVVGLDQYINYYKLQYATLCIRENPGCLFIATNRDSVAHLTDLQEWPGAGCMVAAVCGSTEKEPIVVGKPSTFLMDFLLKKYQIPTSRMCMVGDRLDTDILFGQNAGCRTLLVLSGVTTQSFLEDPSNHIQPEFYTNSVSDLLTLLDK